MLLTGTTNYGHAHWPGSSVLFHLFRIGFKPNYFILHSYDHYFYMQIEGRLLEKYNVVVIITYVVEPHILEGTATLKYFSLSLSLLPMALLDNSTYFISESRVILVPYYY